MRLEGENMRNLVSTRNPGGIEEVSAIAEHRRLENPSSGESYRFLQTGRETNGELLQVEWTVQPGGTAPEHVHPKQEETFRIEEGEIHFLVEGTDQIVRAGETVVVPPGTPHMYRNESDAEVRGVFELRPALEMDRFFETISGLSRDGKTTRSGAPKNPLQLAVFMREFRDGVVVTKPPTAVQGVLFTPLAVLGRALGYRASYAGYRSEISDDSRDV